MIIVDHVAGITTLSHWSLAVIWLTFLGLHSALFCQQASSLSRPCTGSYLEAMFNIGLDNGAFVHGQFARNKRVACIDKTIVWVSCVHLSRYKARCLDFYSAEYQSFWFNIHCKLHHFHCNWTAIKRSGYWSDLSTCRTCYLCLCGLSRPREFCATGSRGIDFFQRTNYGDVNWPYLKNCEEALT